MANTAEKRCRFDNEELGLIGADSLEKFQQSLSLEKVTKSADEDIIAVKYSEGLENVLEHRQEVLMPTSQAAKVWTIQEEHSSLGGYTNPPCPDQSSPAGANQNGNVTSVNGFPLQMYSAGPDWLGSELVPPEYTPTAITMESTSVPHIPNYLALSIITTMFFFIPIAVFAIISSIKANTLKRAGLYTKALEKATQALHLNLLAIVMGVIEYVVAGLLVWYSIKRIEKLTP